jgi:hypothetical protein
LQNESVKVLKFFIVESIGDGIEGFSGTESFKRNRKGQWNHRERVAETVIDQGTAFGIVYWLHIREFTKRMALSPFLFSLTL